jgi:hypothetical protein
MAKRYTDEFRRDAVRMATTSSLERFQFSLKQGYRQCTESAEGVAGYWRSNINWKRFNAASTFIRFRGWAFDAEQMGSATST